MFVTQVYHFRGGVAKSLCMLYNVRMNKEDIYAFLKEQGIEFMAVDHPPAFTVGDLDSFDLPRPESGAKNLFLRDDKKRNYYLLTLKDDKQADLAIFRERAATRRLSFASDDDLARFLGVSPGSVSPFCILNNEEKNVQVFIDDYFKDREICIHPNDNTASVDLETSDLVRVLTEHGNSVRFIEV